MKDLAPLLLTHCIDYLRDRPTGTRYHPKENEYFLDGKLMARIIRHEGNLRAQVNQSESRFFTQIIHELKDFGRIDSPIHKEIFEVMANDNFHRESITVRKVRMLDVLKGRKPMYVGDVKYVPVGDD